MVGRKAVGGYLIFGILLFITVASLSAFVLIRLSKMELFVGDTPTSILESSLISEYKRELSRAISIKSFFKSLRDFGIGKYERTSPTFFPYLSDILSFNDTKLQKTLTKIYNKNYMKESLGYAIDPNPQIEFDIQSTSMSIKLKSKVLQRIEKKVVKKKSVKKAPRQTNKRITIQKQEFYNLLSKFHAVKEQKKKEAIDKHYHKAIEALDKTSNLYNQYKEDISAIAAEFGIDPNLLSATLFMESQFDKYGDDPRSSACGIASMLDSTWVQYCELLKKRGHIPKEVSCRPTTYKTYENGQLKTLCKDYDSRFNPIYSMKAAALYLQTLEKVLKGRCGDIFNPLEEALIVRLAYHFGDVVVSNLPCRESSLEDILPKIYNIFKPYYQTEQWNDFIYSVVYFVLSYTTYSGYSGDLTRGTSYQQEEYESIIGYTTQETETSLTFPIALRSIIDDLSYFNSSLETCYNAQYEKEFLKCLHQVIGDFNVQKIDYNLTQISFTKNTDDIEQYVNIIETQTLQCVNTKDSMCKCGEIPALTNYKLQTHIHIVNSTQGSNFSIIPIGYIKKVKISFPELNISSPYIYVYKYINYTLTSEKGKINVKLSFPYPTINPYQNVPAGQPLPVQEKIFTESKEGVKCYFIKLNSTNFIPFLILCENNKGDILLWNFPNQYAPFVPNRDELLKIMSRNCSQPDYYTFKLERKASEIPMYLDGNVGRDRGQIFMGWKNLTLYFNIIQPPLSTPQLTPGDIIRDIAKERLCWKIKSEAYAYNLTIFNGTGTLVQDFLHIYDYYPNPKLSLENCNSLNSNKKGLCLCYNLTPDVFEQLKQGTAHITIMPFSYSEVR